MNSIAQKVATDYWIEKLENIEYRNLAGKESMKKCELFIKKEDCVYFDSLTSNVLIAEYTVFVTIFNALIQRYFEDCFFVCAHSYEKGIPLLIKADELGKTDTLKGYLERVKNEVQEVHSYLDYEKMDLKVEHFANYTPYLFCYNNTIEEDLKSPFQMKIARKLEHGFGIEINFQEKYVDLYLVQHFLETFKQWFKNLENYFKLKVIEIPIVSKQETNQLLADSMNVQFPDNRSETIVQLFESQVGKEPQQIAFVHQDKNYTYEEVNCEANRLAHFLTEKYSFNTNCLIGIQLERNENLISTILAVLKSGAAYVPMDINYPQKRIEYIQKDSCCSLVIDQDFLEKFNLIKKNYLETNPPKTNQLEDLAYVIYTSGSTGQPKGVMIEHGNLVELVRWARSEFNTSNFNWVYASTSHCFDLSIFEIFYPLTSGIKIRLLGSALEISEAISKDQGVLLNTVPSVVQSLLEEKSTAIKNISVLNMAGEVLPTYVTKKLPLDTMTVRNLYGPSEDTTYSTTYKITGQEISSIPIGKPVNNCFALVLDDNLQLLPKGVVGKLYLSGSGLARGYLGKPNLTKEKFIKNPFGSPEVLYDTGDLVKCLPSGNLEFFGRKDTQVKLNGFRIELGEIESAILKFSSEIKQVVVAVKLVNKQQSLVAYYKSDQHQSKSALRNYLNDVFPKHLVPHYYQELDEIPLSPNGKINRKALPEVGSDTIIRKEYVAPKNDTEIKLVRIWEDVLGTENIGIDDNFFELGGHSLMISQIINGAYKQLDLDISIRVFYKNPTIRSLSNKALSSVFKPIPKAPVALSYPVTNSQRQLWLSSQLEGASKAYQIAGAKELKGNIEIEIFQKAFDYVIDRHEILRTYFRTDKTGDLQQYIMDSSQIKESLAFKDVSHLKKPLQAVNRHIKTENNTSYDLERTPLFKLHLFKLNATRYIFSLNMHHIIGDGWSLEVLTNEILTIYTRFLQNNFKRIPKLNIQFKDYSNWLNTIEKEEDFKISKTYWLKSFEGELPVLQLPTFAARPLVKTYHGEQVKNTFSLKEVLNIKAFSKKHQVSLFTTLMTALKALLSRYSNQYDLTFGTPVAGRIHPDLEQQLGLYINTIPIRTKFSGTDSFLSLLQKEKQQLALAYEHQNFPFSSLLEQLKLKRDTSRAPLFDIMVVLQNQKQLLGFNEDFGSLNLEVETYTIKKTTAQFDISFVFTEQSDNTLSLEVDYNTDIYSKNFINGLLAHLKELIGRVIAKPMIAINEIDFLKSNEKKYLLKTLNNHNAIREDHRTVVDMFRDQVQETPNNIAVVYESFSTTYLELEKKSNQLANCLLSHGVVHGDCVALQLDRNEQLVIAILAILKLGASYAPIDLNNPIQRTNFIVKDTAAKMLIDSAYLNEINLDDWSEIYELNKLVDNSFNAYVIYTSGSTGLPKGVPISHKSLVNFITFYELQTCKTSLTCNFVFDVSVMEIFTAVTSGSTLVIPPAAIVMNPKRYADFLFENQINHCYLHPMHLEEIAAQLSLYPEVYLKRILVGVESIKKESIQWFYEKGVQIINGYGPSETTICATYYKLNKLDDIQGLNIPIGKPLPNYQVYVLNQNSEVLEAAGVIGELCISGIGLTKGYINARSVDLNNFIENPFAPGKTLYRTGDLARWLPDGNLEFVGRKDQQVKINGNRIELGEIESTILSYPIDLEYVLVQVKEVAKQKSIVAYLKAKAPIDKKALRVYLKDRLPHYMLPNYFVLLDHLPLTSNGKIDRKNLPEITENDRIRNEYKAPIGLYETRVVDLWKDVLKVEDIGVSDDFFELGGHSLLMSMLVNQYQKNFKVAIDLKQIYIHTTPAEHAQIVSVAKQSQIPPLITLKVQEHYDVSSAQLRFWLLFKLRGKTKEFNIYDAVKLPDELDVNMFESAFNELVVRHEILRTSFTQIEDVPKQKIAKHEPLKIPIHHSKQLENVKEQVFGFEFDLNKAPLYKVALVGANGDFVLLFNMHHIISDGWSMNIISKELIALYESKLLKRKADLPILEVQYKDYSYWQNELFSHASFESQKEFWQKNLAGKLPYIQLPPDFVSTNEVSETGSGYYTICLGNDLKKDIIQLNQEHKVSVFAFFTSCLKILLNRITSVEDIIIGVPVANRNHYQLKNMIGCFLNTLMIRNTINRDDTFVTFLANVNNTLIDALANQNYPFENVLEDLNIPREYHRFPVSSIFFNMLDFETSSLETISDFNPKTGKLEATPKFDFECYLKSYVNGYELKCVYDPKVFKLSTIQFWIDEYAHLLKQLVEKPGKCIKEIKFFDEVPFKPNIFLPKVEFDFFEPEAIEQTIVQRFEEQVTKFPNRLALGCDGRFLSYKELNTRANYIGEKILENTKKSFARIALLLNHREEAIVSMLACLKAGCSYVPIDLANPVNRIRYILKDAECQLMICSSETEEKANLLKSDIQTFTVLSISSLEITETKNLNIPIDPFTEAYVLYTSGSTGIPKGVIQNHRNVLHYIRVYTNNICINNKDNLSLFSTYSFDASVKDIYGALLNGAKVCIYDITEKGLHHLSKWLLQEQITIMHMVPTVYRHFIQELGSLEILESIRILDLGGESCHLSDFKSFKKHFTKQAFFVNDYGPTEATIISQNFLSHADSVESNNIPLGSAVLETEVFLLDEQNNKLGIYQEGEIAYKSPYLALGYLNRTELTTTAFLHIDSLGGRIYKSGDVGRMLPNGEIQFLGRKDNQVKLNGQRIELLEIEQNLLKIPGIEQAIVLLKTIDGQDRLVGYIESEKEINTQGIVSLLSYDLPLHMIPLSYVFITDFPRTRTGKVDRKRLQLPSIIQEKKEFVGPRNDLEHRLIEIISSCLDIDSSTVGIDDNFFDLGGSSLKMIKVLNQINTAFDMDLDLLTLFTYPSIALLVDKIYGKKSQKELMIESDISESIDDIIDLIGE